MKKQNLAQQNFNYSGNKRANVQPVPFVPGPNPDLPKFIAKHSTPYDPKTDRYDVPAFDRDIVVDKAAEPKAIYDMHTYWSKKHWKAICQYIRHYLPKQFYPDGLGLVADPFCGSGMTGVAALMEKKGCVLFDASPAAAFIAHHYVHPVDPSLLEQAYQKMLAEEYEADLKIKLKKIAGRDIVNLQEELDWLYETKCDRCDGKATTEYVVYSQTFQCPNCGEIVALFDCPTVNVEYVTTSARGKSKTESKKRTVCPLCYARSHNRGRPEFVISTRQKRHGEKPVKVSYLCENGCSPKREFRLWNDTGKRKRRYFEEVDLDRIKQLSKVEIPHNYPKRKMMDVEDDSKPWGDNWRPGRNFRSIAELYSHRNFWALAAVAAAGKELYLGVRLVNLVGNNATRMRQHREAGGGLMKGTYYIPQVNREAEVRDIVSRKHRTLVDATSASDSFANDCLVSAECAQQMALQPNSVDMIFTDPPYAGTVQYGELNFVWEAWLGFDGSWRKKEAIVKDASVDPEGIYTVEQWEVRLREAFRRCYTALKPGRWMCVCYHDTAEGTWKRVQDMLLDIGFEIHSVTVLDPLQKSANQINAEKVVKSDLVLNCRKPKTEQLELQLKDGEVPASIHDRVRTILEDALSEHPGLTRDKLFDIAARRLLERAQMVEFRFEDILGEIATKAEGDRWYLKAELEQLSKDDLANEETAGEALTRFTLLRCIGTPAKYAVEIALTQPALCELNSKGELSEKTIEDWINDHLAKEDRELLLKKKIKRLELGGALAGIEFYDALFFYFTKYMKGKKASQLPKRNLAGFLEEYLIHFQDGDKWLYRAPEGREIEELRKARQSGLGRRIRAFANALRDNDRQFIDQHRPDVRTFVEWMRYCAAFGRNEDGAVLFDKGGFTVNELQSVIVDEKEEETAYDAVRGFADLCKRRSAPETEEDDSEKNESDEE
ncbi:MAG: DNA methyltransferase [Verrucomicrobiae bacterium]|nr:DNA methyltransferase [Verrucomicrobiae bacterium]